MIIKIDETGRITSVINVGGKENPSEGLYKIDGTQLSEEVKNDLFSYKYINGELIHVDESDTEKLQEVKNQKINFLSYTCNQLIENGIDWNGEHYSLQYSDQINLSKLASQAVAFPQMPIFYHADGKLCRQYTPEEMLALSQACVGWVTYHTTYFNYAKAYINDLNDFDKIAAFKYGQMFEGHEQLTQEMNTIIETTGVVFDQRIDDYTNYNCIREPLKQFFTHSKDEVPEIIPEEVDQNEE